MKKLNVPTKITISRIILALILILMLGTFYILDETNILKASSLNLYFLNHEFNLIYLIAFFIFVIASISDFLDGYLARKNNEITNLGKFLDPLADKVLVNSLLIFLSIGFSSNQQSHKIFWICVVIMIVRDLCVDGVRFLAAKSNIVIAANFFGKAKTVLQMTTIILFLLNDFPFSYLDFYLPKYLNICDLFLYITTIVSVISGVIYIFENKKVLKN